jgi:hypothetical protein
MAIEKNNDINDFLNYFDDQWVLKYSGWYEGFAAGLLSTYNGLESFNASIKKEITEFQRINLGFFFTNFENDFIVKSSNLLNEKFDQPRLFENDVSIELATWTKAFQLNVNNETKIIEVTRKNPTFHYIPTSTYSNKDGSIDQFIKNYIKELSLHLTLLLFLLSLLSLSHILLFSY